jgi:hypothetical protein
MPDDKPLTCPRCGEVIGPTETVTLASKMVVDRQTGQTVPGSEEPVALFHPECWEAWKAEHDLS